MAGLLLSSGSTSVMKRAISFLSACSAEERAPHMEQIAALLQSAKADVRRAAWTTFSACSTDERAPYIERVLVHLSDESASDVRMMALSWLSNCGAEERGACLPAVVELLDDDDPRVRREAWAAFRACSATERARHVRRVAELLESGSKSLRVRALQVLESCTARQRAPYMERVAALLSEDEYDDVRSATLAFFGSCSTDERAPYMGVIAALLADINSALREATWSFFRCVTMCVHMGKCIISQTSLVFSFVQEGVLLQRASTCRRIPSNVLTRQPVNELKLACFPLAGWLGTLLNHEDRDVANGAVAYFSRKCRPLVWHATELNAAGQGTCQGPVVGHGIDHRPVTAHSIGVLQAVACCPLYHATPSYSCCSTCPSVTASHSSCPAGTLI